MRMWSVETLVHFGFGEGKVGRAIKPCKGNNSSGGNHLTSSGRHDGRLNCSGTVLRILQIGPAQSRGLFFLVSPVQRSATSGLTPGVLTGKRSEHHCRSRLFFKKSCKRTNLWVVARDPSGNFLKS